MATAQFRLRDLWRGCRRMRHWCPGVSIPVRHCPSFVTRITHHSLVTLLTFRYCYYSPFVRAITHGSLVTALTPRYLTYSRQVSKFFLDGAFERLRFASKILPQTLTSTFFQKLVYCVSPRRNKLLNAGEIKFLLKSADLIFEESLKFASSPFAERKAIFITTMFLSLQPIRQRKRRF